MSNEEQVANLPENDDEYTHMEWLFLVQVLGYCQGKLELRGGIRIPDEFHDREFLEGLGEEGQVSLCLPLLKSLFARASRTWPNSIFKIFTPTRVPPIYDDRGYLQLPTLTSSTDNEQSSSDQDWVYPPSPMPLPSLEIPSLPANPHQESSEPELSALDIPLCQFEDLNVSPIEQGDQGEGMEMSKTSNVPEDVEMVNMDQDTHQPPTDALSSMSENFDDIYDNDMPPLGDRVVITPPIGQEWAYPSVADPHSNIRNHAETNDLAQDTNPDADTTDHPPIETIEATPSTVEEDELTVDTPP
jgi:hypothetical protein